MTSAQQHIEAALAVLRRGEVGAATWRLADALLLLAEQAPEGAVLMGIHTRTGRGARLELAQCPRTGQRRRPLP